MWTTSNNSFITCLSKGLRLENGTDLKCQVMPRRQKSTMEKSEMNSVPVTLICIIPYFNN